MEPTQTGAAPVEGHKPVGPVIGSIIVVLLIILGGLYFWGERLNQSGSSSVAAPDPALQSLKTQGTSDEVSALETDAAATDLNGLDKELGDIQKELSAPATQ